MRKRPNSVSVMVTDGELEALRNAASSEQRSLSAYIRLRLQRSVPGFAEPRTQGMKAPKRRTVQGGIDEHYASTFRSP